MGHAGPRRGERHSRQRRFGRQLPVQGMGCGWGHRELEHPGAHGLPRGTQGGDRSLAFPPLQLHWGDDRGRSAILPDVRVHEAGSLRRGQRHAADAAGCPPRLLQRDPAGCFPGAPLGRVVPAISHPHDLGVLLPSAPFPQVPRRAGHGAAVRGDGPAGLKRQPDRGLSGEELAGVLDRGAIRLSTALSSASVLGAGQQCVKYSIHRYADT
mmetsp:Transcript_11853/g.33404  ORF Transcript_11853/g.33404 Transcript_11853/m.33404 type:complete len:211 (-) Transcript_11853:2730-3362(-)